MSDSDYNCGTVLRGVLAFRADEALRALLCEYQKVSSRQNNPPSCPPTRVFLALKLNFLQNYLLYNQGVRESGLATNQEVARSSRAGRTINSTEPNIYGYPSLA